MYALKARCESEMRTYCFNLHTINGPCRLSSSRTRHWTTTRCHPQTLPLEHTSIAVFENFGISSCIYLLSFKFEDTKRQCDEHDIMVKLCCRLQMIDRKRAILPFSIYVLGHFCHTHFRKFSQTLLLLLFVLQSEKIPIN